MCQTARISNRRRTLIRLQAIVRGVLSVHSPRDVFSLAVRRGPQTLWVQRIGRQLGATRGLAGRWAQLPALTERELLDERQARLDPGSGRYRIVGRPQPLYVAGARAPVLGVRTDSALVAWYMLPAHPDFPGRLTILVAQPGMRWAFSVTLSGACGQARARTITTNISAAEASAFELRGLPPPDPLPASPFGVGATAHDRDSRGGQRASSARR